MLDLFRKLFSRQKPVILVYKAADDFWTYVELQLSQSSRIRVSVHNEAEYKVFDVGRIRHHVAVSGSSEVSFTTSEERFDRRQITQPTQMMQEMEQLLRVSRQPNSCSILGCSLPATMDVVCVRFEMGGDFGTFSSGTPYQVCELPEHLAEVKAKHPGAVRYNITSHHGQMSQS